uniref:Uncharacterized protein n=1 Tax=Arundo donax TaxID=35708 RepID=A0A0A8YGP2_ARUDO
MSFYDYFPLLHGKILLDSESLTSPGFPLKSCSTGIISLKTVGHLLAV